MGYSLQNSALSTEEKIVAEKLPDHITTKIKNVCSCKIWGIKSWLADPESMIEEAIQNSAEEILKYWGKNNIESWSPARQISYCKIIAERTTDKTINKALADAGIQTVTDAEGRTVKICTRVKSEIVTGEGEVISLLDNIEDDVPDTERKILMKELLQCALNDIKECTEDYAKGKMKISLKNPSSVRDIFLLATISEIKQTILAGKYKLFNSEVSNLVKAIRECLYGKNPGIFDL